ncbi:hypothetical protein KFU94_50430 [Chloroflexi bacterium TSY]|nr:hypothetical protein [Chloroflexi bacterium TSY]
MEVNLKSLAYPVLMIGLGLILVIGIGAVVTDIELAASDEKSTSTDLPQPLIKTNAFPTEPPVGRPTVPSKTPSKQSLSMS